MKTAYSVGLFSSFNRKELRMENLICDPAPDTRRSYQERCKRIITGGKRILACGAEKSEKAFV